MLDEFDQLGRTPIVEQSQRPIAGHGVWGSITTQ